MDDLRSIVPLVKVRYFLIVGFILIAWLLGCVFVTRPLEQSLQRATLDYLTESKFQNAFDQVSVRFAGQEATLTGKVIDQESKDLAEKVVLKEIRLKDQHEAHNPVTRVHNQIQIDNSTLPRPWLIITAYEGKLRIDGVMADAEQKFALQSDLTIQMQGVVPNDQSVIAAKAIPCQDWPATMAALPNFPQLTAGKSGLAARVGAVTTGDGTWKSFSHDVTNSEIADFLSRANVSESMVEFALNAMRTTPLPGPPKIEQPNVEDSQK